MELERCKVGKNIERCQIPSNIASIHHPQSENVHLQLLQERGCSEGLKIKTKHLNLCHVLLVVHLSSLIDDCRCSLAMHLERIHAKA